MRFSKELGQFFLKQRYINKIVSCLDLEASKNILEIGPGLGQLTQYLVKKAKKLWCVEIDSRLIPILKNKFSLYSNLEVINQDILKLDLSKFPPKLIIFGNIPYSISTNLIHYLVRYKEWIDKAYLTLQKEFATKLTAQPKKKGYSMLSCFLQYFAEVNILFFIPKQGFYPQPKVDSAFVKIDFRNQPLYKVKNEQLLFKLIKTAFSQRRKKLTNSLGSFCNKKILEKYLRRAGKREDVRADDLSLQDYCKLANYLEPTSSTCRVEKNGSAS